MAPFLRPSTWTLALLRGALWLSVLWALLSPACCSHSPPKWRFSTSEIVIPRKVPQRVGKSDTSGHITYSMRFRGQRHVVHMKLKKNMIPQNFPVYTSNDQGAQQKDYPFVPRDCYFYSYLEGVPGSQATLDTCTGGLKGMIQVDDFTYEIKPLASSSKFEHVISLLVVDERSHESKKCRNDEIMAKVGDLPEETKLAGSPRAAPVYLWRYHLKGLGIHYTVTYELFRQTGRNSSTSVELILIMNSISDSIYKISGLIVYARGVWIWNKENLHKVPSETSYDPWGTMAGFGVWKSKKLKDTYATTALLLASKPKNSDYGAFQGGLCNPNWGVLYTYVGKNHLFLAGSFLAHALGHLLDIKHDTPGCVCFRRSSCLMDEFPTLQDMISNCTHDMIHSRIHSWDPCMSSERHTAEEVNIHAIPRCGNKRVEASEKCDCGSVKDCTTDKCCEVNCDFTQGSSCAAGGCCRSCKFAPTGTICRDKNGICDLPEYCSGVSEHCPGNFYIMDGTPCSPLAVCIAGNCSDRHLQCQALFGYQVKDGSPACYNGLNVIGDRFGNCGIRIIRGGSQPVPCQKEDVFCGMIHCDGVRYIPGGGEHTTFYHLKVQDVKEEQCFGYDIHHGTELPEMGLVVDGATCGPGKYCKAQRCVAHPTLNFNCNISSCNFRGVCNNKGNCHCVRGWQPPHCLQIGKGGSTNSGPPPTTQKKYKAEIHVSTNRLIVILSIRMILILASILLGAVFKAIFVSETKEEE